MGSDLGCGLNFISRSRMSGQFGHRDIVERSYILVYMLKGRGRYCDANGNICEIKPGTLYQRFPGVRHESIFEPGEDFFECYVVMPRQIFELLLGSGAISLKRPCLDIGIRQDAYAGFESFLKELKDQDERRLHLTVASMHKFAAELLSLAESEERPDAFIKNACALLEESPTVKLHMPSVARKLGMSYSKFRQQFLRRSGISPGEYRIKRRMELAQRLLASEDLTIKEVARETGHPDVYSFSKQFKNYAGQTPGMFMKARRTSR